MLKYRIFASIGRRNRCIHSIPHAYFSIQRNVYISASKFGQLFDAIPLKKVGKNDPIQNVFLMYSYLPNVSSECKVVRFCHDVSQFRFQVVTLLAIFVTVNANFGFAINFAHFSDQAIQFNFFILWQGFVTNLKYKIQFPTRVNHE